MSQAQRGTGEETVAPSFSIGMSPPATRRSTRRAAAVASDRIRVAQGAANQRRSTRLAARHADASRIGGVERGASSPARRNVCSATRARALGTGTGTKDAPIVLDDDENEEMDLKPAARGAKGKAVVKPEAQKQKPPADFKCAICLDAPDCLTEVASVDGCSHRFCFDCIDKWALTENKCPCCKARFRKIDRVAPLPPTPPGPARRGKRKRAAAASGPGATARSPARARVNSRAVEDRNQESASSFPINAAIVEQILASFSNYGGQYRGTGQVTFGTDGDGRPSIRMIRPASGGMVGVMEMLLPTDANSNGGGGNGPAARGASGRSAGGATRMAHVTFRRAPASSAASGAAASQEGGTRGSTEVARRTGAVSAATRAGAPIRRFFESRGPPIMASPRSRSPRRRRASPGAASAADRGSAPRAGEGSSGRPGGFTIRFMAPGYAASSNRSTAGASGSSTDDEPIVID